MSVLRDLTYSDNREVFEHMYHRFESGWHRSIDTPKGWTELILNLDKEINEIDPDYKLYQVKSKFRGLRYYMSCSDNVSEENREKIYQLVREAESKSMEICEVCGGHGESVSDDGWARTLCAEHAKLVSS